MTCTHWAPAGYCGHAETRLYQVGRRCPTHTPAALAGRPEPGSFIDPASTLDGLRDAKGLTYSYRPTDSALIDQRAIASGKRRSRSGDYRLAQKAEAERRAAS